MQQSPTAAETSAATPAPWIAKGNEVRWQSSPDSIGLQVARFAGTADDAEAVANAQLAAAGHEMLEALKATEALDDRDDCAECEGEGEPEACPLCFIRADDARLMRRAAIAKAEGRS